MPKTIVVKKESKSPLTQKVPSGWSASEIEFLKENYAKLKMCELAKKLKKSIIDIHAQAVTLKLTKDKKVVVPVSEKVSRNFWTKEETKFLKENFSKLSLEEIAQKLNRSTGSISGKASWLNLKSTPKSARKRTRKVWEQSEVDYLNEYYGKKSVKTIAKYLKRTEYSIISKASELKNNKSLQTPPVVKDVTPKVIGRVKETPTVAIKSISVNLVNIFLSVLTITNISALILLMYSILLK